VEKIKRNDYFREFRVDGRIKIKSNFEKYAHEIETSALDTWGSYKRTLNLLSISD
jgi:hypothetical protein